MSSESKQLPVTVAVIGTGLAGLTTAYLLETLPFLGPDGKELEFEVHMFERNHALGMDSTSISVKTESGASFRMDTPMRSVNGGSHSRVVGLYRHIGTTLLPSNFSFSFSRLSPFSSTPRLDEPAEYVPEQKIMLLYEGSNGSKGVSFPSRLGGPISFATHFIHLVLLTLSYLHLLFLAFFYVKMGLTNVRGNKGIELAPGARLIGLRNVANESMDEFCDRHFIWKVMREEVLSVLYAAVSTVGRAEVGALPVGEILEYIVSTFGSDHFVCANGVQDTVNRLSSPVPTQNIHLNTTISHLSHFTSNGSSKRRIHFADSKSPPLDFDYVVFATQANQASRILRASHAHDLKKSAAMDHGTEVKRMEALEKFEYVRTLVVNHTDSSLLPPNPLDRRDLNLVTYATPTSSRPSSPTVDCGTEMTLPRSSVQATHIISRTHPKLLKGRKLEKAPAHGDSSSEYELLQTTNPIVEIHKSRVLSASWYERAKVCPSSKNVLKHFLLPDGEKRREGEAEFQGADSVYFVGSWAAEGLPLLEGCVASAERLVIELARREGVQVQIPF